MGSGSTILATDYNNIRNKVAKVLGAGTGQYGYGQSLNSSGETSGQNIGAAEWNALRYDLINIKLHQTGSQPTVVSPSSGNVIFYGSSHPNNSYNTLADAVTATKFDIGASRKTFYGRGTVQTSSSWSDLAYCTAQMSFSSSAAARYFFNAGSVFRFTSSLDSDGSAQSDAWSSLLSSAGTIDFGADTSTLKTVYELTSSDQLIYSITDSGAYSTNVYRIYAKCNVADNSTGTATSFTFTIQYDDNHTNQYYDTVGGTLAMSVNEAKDTGSMLPSGTFSITSPSYSYSAMIIS